LVIPARRAAQRTVRAAPVQPPPVRASDDQPFGALADRQVDRLEYARVKRLAPPGARLRDLKGARRSPTMERVLLRQRARPRMRRTLIMVADEEETGTV
jgi:hypothetical protein